MNSLIKRTIFYLAKHKNYSIDFFVLLSFIMFSCWLMTWTLGYDNQTIILSGKLYSDFAAHLPLIRSFSMGDNFPVEYPQFPGEPIRYHYFFYLLVALIERCGFNFAVAVNFLSVIGMSLLLWMIYKLGCLFFNKKITGFLAAILFLFNGSLSFIEYFKQHGFGLEQFRQIVDQVSFASFGPWDGKSVSAFWNWNIYTNQRHLALSYGLVLLAIWPALSLIVNGNLRLKRLFYFLVPVIFLILPFLHQAGLIILICVVFSWMLLNKKLSLDFKLIYVFSIVTSLLVMFIFTPGAQQRLVWQIGFLAQDAQLATIVKYWFSNLGLYFVFLPLFMFFSTKNYQRFLLASYPLFVVANLLKLSTDIINNHKFISFFIIVLNLGMAAFIVQLMRGKLLGKIIGLIILFFVTFSGVLDAFPVINDTKYYIDDFQRVPAAAWIKQYTPPNSTFVTNIYLYSPVTLVGRKQYLDYGYFAWSLGYDDQSRRMYLPMFFAVDTNKRNVCQLLLNQRIDYIYLNSDQGDFPKSIDLSDSLIVKTFTPSFVSIKNEVIYDVRKNCGNGE